MTFLTRDIAKAGHPQLCARDPSRIPLALAQHILRRQIDSIKRTSVLVRWLLTVFKRGILTPIEG